MEGAHLARQEEEDDDDDDDDRSYGTPTILPGELPRFGGAERTLETSTALKGAHWQRGGRRGRTKGHQFAHKR